MPILDSHDEESDKVALMSEVARSQKIEEGDKIPMCLSLFDDVIKGGFTPGNLIIVSAQTGQGKTSFCQHLTYNFIKTLKKEVLWFTYELMACEIWDKFRAMGISEENRISDDDFIFCPFKHKSGNVAWIEEKIQEAKKLFPDLSVVFIDHLGFLQPSIKGNGVSGDLARNLSAYLGQIARELKTLALQEKVVIVLPVHMRKTENPSLNDIRDSSGIAQEADLVFILNRIPEPGDETGEAYTDYTRITLAKNRKTGKTVRGYFKLVNELFIYQPDYKPAKPVSVFPRRRSGGVN